MYVGVNINLVRIESWCRASSSSFVLRVVSAHLMDTDRPVWLCSGPAPILLALFVCDCRRVSTCTGLVASLGAFVPGTCRCWGLGGVRGGRRNMHWVFGSAVPLVSVVLPFVTIVMPPVIKRLSLYLFEVLR